MVTRQKGMRGRLDALEVAFDDERVVVDAGLILPATLCDRLGATGLLDGLVKRPADPPSGAGAGAKALSVVFAMLAGADSIAMTSSGCAPEPPGRCLAFVRAPAPPVASG